MAFVKLVRFAVVGIALRTVGTAYATAGRRTTPVKMIVRLMIRVRE